MNPTDDFAPLGLGPTARRGWLLLLMALVAIVSYLALSPNPPKGLDTGWDKVNHALAFAALALVAELAFWHWPTRRVRNTAWLIGYGAAIELIQTQVPGRSAEWMDLAADAVGISLGLAVAVLGIAVLRWVTEETAPVTQRAGSEVRRRLL